ncbi:unnamed protein product, partial [Coregonus sp. 'balchen']
EAIIAGLHSETTYSVTVAAYTTKGDGARSKAKVITTTGAVPGHPTMMISTTIGNTALIQWQPPKDMAFTSREFKRTDDHHTVTGLYKGATYVFRLSAHNRAGTGLAWEPPALSERNGKILQYIVVYRDINSQTNSTNRTSDTSMTIQGLKPDTTYDIRVQAFTSKGGGPISPSIQSRTMSTSPAFATSFGVKAVMKTSVLLTWEVPENYKSQVPFKILYNQQSVEVQGNLKRKLITRLQPDTDYSFVLMSRGNSAGGLQQQVSIRTAPDLLRNKPLLYSTQQNQGGKLTIDLPKVQTTAQVRWYYIVVVPVSQSSSWGWENPDEMDLDELLDSGERPVLRQRRQVEPTRPYIAAKLDLLPATFTLGDEKRYNGFYNRPLPRHQQSVEQPEMLWVMGPVLAVVLIIIIVIAILFFKRKRMSPLPKDDHSGG